jgi:hypothetical protein
MFGYVKTCTPELKVKEYEFYKAVYCGLCRSLGRMNCFLSFTLSYDFVFLALLRLACSGETIELGKKVCMAHPFHRRPYVKNNASMEYTASAATLLLLKKAEDDQADSHGISRLFASFSLPFFRSAFKKAEKNRLFQDKSLESVISQCLFEISEKEKKKTTEVYELAEPFGRLLGSIFSWGIEEESMRRPLYEFGRRIGRWIYLVDAAEDTVKDRKEGNFNPFVLSDDDLRSDFRENILTSLTLELIEAEKSFNLLTFSDKGIESILQNILYLGMPQTAEKVFCCDKTQKRKKFNSKQELT